MDEQVNPYSPPQSTVADVTDSARRRPLLVWVITVFYGIGALGSMYSTILALSGSFPGTGPAARFMAQLNLFDHVLTLLGAAFTVWAVVSLFRLKARAWPLFVALFAIAPLVMAYYLAAKPAYRDFLLETGFVGPAISLLIGAGVLFHVYRLRRKGVLRP
jgi:hypothetical protein